MKKTEKKIYSADDIFGKWVGSLRTESQTERYLHRERPELLIELFMQFVENKVDMDTARLYRKKAMEAMTTDGGRKGKGRYKGWKEACFTDFDSILAHYYIDALTPEEKSVINARISGVKDEPADGVYRSERPFKYIENDKDINNYMLNKYGDSCTDLMIREAHRVGSSFNLEFIKDNFMV